MPKLHLKNPLQKDAYKSPWSLKEVILIKIWKISWVLFFRYTPKKTFSYWRVLLLRVFGAKIDSDVFIYSSAKIFIPWNLIMKSKSCLGPNCEIYNLGPVQIEKKATISQYVYVCNGSHDLNDTRLPLLIGHIHIGENVFIGAKALIMPGIKIHDSAVVGAGSVVTKDVDPYTIVAGNPAKFIKKRVIND